MSAAVHSVHRFVFSVPDLAEAQTFYTAFGLEVVPLDGTLALRTFGHSHTWGTVLQHSGLKRLLHVTYGAYAREIDALHSRAAAAGALIDCPAHARGMADAHQGFWLRDPDGIPAQILVTDKVSPSAATVPSPTTPTQPGHAAAHPRSQTKPVRPRYLSHILRFTPDVPAMTRFCAEVLGLRLSDRSGEIIAFIHTPHGSDHHLVAFAKSHAPGLHHSSWDVGSVEEVGLGAEQMRAAGWDQGWGLGRHVLGSNHFHYVRDPWGSFCEYSSGIDFIPPGLEWPAADHPPADALYVWGPPPPPDFITNHEYPA